jgi:hypothetical protein
MTSILAPDQDPQYKVNEHWIGLWGAFVVSRGYYYLKLHLSLIWRHFGWRPPPPEEVSLMRPHETELLRKQLLAYIQMLSLTA